MEPINIVKTALKVYGTINSSEWSTDVRRDTCTGIKICREFCWDGTLVRWRPVGLDWPPLAGSSVSWPPTHPTESQTSSDPLGQTHGELTTHTMKWSKNRPIFIKVCFLGRIFCVLVAGLKGHPLKGAYQSYQKYIWQIMWSRCKICLVVKPIKMNKIGQNWHLKYDMVS